MGKNAAEMRGKSGAANTRRSDRRRIFHRRSSDSGWRNRETTFEEGTERRTAIGGITPVGEMREAFDRSSKNGERSEIAILIGSLILGISVATTLILALSINARANRILEGDAAARRAGANVVDRVEGKIDSIERKVDALATTTTIRPARTTTTVRRSSPTTRTTVTTTQPTTTTTVAVPRVTTTTKPCLLAIGDTCLL